ncbi:MAG: hypothetical protein M0R33_18050 [Methylomonas sp.]|jgi:hypothetical protein|uniref:hypothetical protein n=1 Tax=Methylomonas sp. TaxID=418 RepID=UPI0025F07FCA|nr:hypothetical protein [Methylomonas sp.]MCK9608351.1 hypothetical protein [Methylomonas sp.]
MRALNKTSCLKATALFWGFIWFAGFSNTSIALDINQASQQIKTRACKDNLTVDQALEKSIKSHSQRDIGWRSFQEDDHYDVERAVLINKAMELRYRWRVFADGSIQPQSKRAENLCRLDTD